MASSVSFVTTFYYGSAVRYNCGVEAYAYVVDSVSGLPVPDGTTIQVGMSLGTETSGGGAPGAPAAPGLGTSEGTVFGFVKVGTVAVIGSPPTPVLRRLLLARAQSATNTVDGLFEFDNRNPIGGCITNIISGSSVLNGTRGDAKVLLEWAASVSVTDSAVPYFTTIQRKPTSSGTFVSIAVAPQGATSYVDSTPVNGVSYHYRVVHSPAVGRGMFSAAEGITRITSNTITATPRGVKQFWGQIVQA